MMNRRKKEIIKKILIRKSLVKTKIKNSRIINFSENLAEIKAHQNL